MSTIQRRVPVVLALCALAMAPLACDDESAGTPPAPEAPTCQASDQAFVRHAVLAVTGRRPTGQAEVLTLTALLEGARAQSDDATARRVVVRVLMQDGTFRQRWSEFMMDHLRVLRTRFVRNQIYDLVQAKNCYGVPSTEAFDDGGLAAWVRDADPTQDSPWPKFTLGQLLNSSLSLDDVSPVFRAHLFAMLAFPLNGANVAPLELERARRVDFGTQFEDIYLNRDPGCLNCHNSRNSVTYSSNEAYNRFFAPPHRFEEAIFGSPDLAGIDPISHRSVLKHLGVASTSGRAPWGWDGERCSTIAVPSEIDPLGVDARFASIRSTPDDPNRGYLASVWSLEQSLRRGFEQIRARGLPEDPEAELDPDAAFAYLVAQSFVEAVWSEVMGSPLTIAHGFPRSSDQREILVALTTRFVDEGFSLGALLEEILTRPEFNAEMPHADCWSSPYALGRAFDPWAVDGEEFAQNSRGDIVHHVSSRPLRRSVHLALEWDPPPEFPDPEEEAFQAAIGFYLTAANPGFRGLDFQARLAWESRYGSCDPPERREDDFVRRVTTDAVARGATVEDAVIAMKDRLLGEVEVATAERLPMEDLIGMSLAAPAVPEIEPGLRRICGAFLSTPQFLLGGAVPDDSSALPVVAPPGASLEDVCEVVASRLDTSGEPFALRCEGALPTVTPR